MTVQENLELSLDYAARHRAKGDHRAAALDILRMVGLDAKTRRIRSARLTQIEMRKLELARAIAARPSLPISTRARVAEQNFNQATTIADRGYYIIVHRQIKFEGHSTRQLTENELVKKYYLGA